jgi:hypothetical protein
MMPLRNFMIAAFAGLSVTSTALAATISSTTTGGLWGDVATWAGSVVPGASDDAIINGPVSVESSSFSCASVTIASGAALQNGGGLGWVTLYVTGNVTNNGTIRNNPTANAFYIEVKGDIVNNGSWVNAGTYVGGMQPQAISQATGTYFGGNWFRHLSSGYTDTFALTALTDLTFSNQLDLVGSDSGTTIWTSFDMAGKVLNLTGAASAYNGVIKNATLFCHDSSAIYSMTFRGPTTLNGAVSIHNSSVTFEGDVTVADTLQNGGSLGWITVYFKGKFTNNGVLRNNPRGYSAYWEMKGDIVNNGSWQNAGTYVGGMNAQTISLATGKTLGGEWFRHLASGYTDTFALTALTDLTFSKKLELSGSDSGTTIWTTLNMAGKTLNLTGAASSNYGVIKNTTLFCHDSSAIYSMTFRGPTTLKGAVSIHDSRVTFEGDVTVADTLQNGGSLGWITVYFKGKFTNNGVLRNNPRGYSANWELQGDIVNNGSWENAGTYVGGMNAQTISLATGKTLGGEWFRHLASGYTDSFALTALTDLTFSKKLELSGSDSGTTIWTTLDMAGKTLNLTGAASSNYGVIKNAILFCHDSSAIYSMTFRGPTTLKGAVSIHDARVTFEGDVTVADTLQNGGGLGWITTYLMGNLTNNGVLRNNPRGNAMYLSVYGNIENRGIVANSNIALVNTGRPALVDGVFGSTVSLETETGKTPGVVKAGPDFVMQKALDVKTGKTLEIPVTGELSLLSGATGGGTIVNKGIMRQRIANVANGAQPLHGAGFVSMRVQNKGSADTVRVSTFAALAHSAMVSSVRRWWRVENDDTLKSYSVVLTYADSLLNGNAESRLDAYLTKDSGATWVKISNPINTVRDTVANTIAVGSDQQPIAAGAGDIVLSSGDVVRLASISSSVIGRSDIRVGPPNRYTIAYWNNSSTPTGSFFLNIKTQGGVAIRSAIVNTFDSQTMTYPRDSLMFDTASNSVLFFVAGLGPKELRTFDVILTADLSSHGEPLAFVPLIWMGVAWVATAVAEEYASNYAVNACYEMWRPYASDTEIKTLIKDAAYHTYKRTNEQFNVKEAVGKKVAEEVVKTVERSTGRVIASPLFLAKDIYDCMDNMFKGMKDYVNGGFDNNERSLRKVTSWDPNAKAGPAGYGDKGYLATDAPVTYTIFFENKKEATAAAYRIEVRDTLDASVFDAASVSFGPMSHKIGVANRQSNVLTWVFDSIELPPNANPPEGEGWVQFTVHPKSGLATGTELRNTATITFDINPPITTDTALNVLDFNAPVTSSPKAAFTGDDSIAVTFKVSDSGSGVKTSNVFVSYENGPFILAGNTATGSLTLPARTGAKHRFYIISQDNVGNTEEPDSIFEATPVLRTDRAMLRDNFLRMPPAFANTAPVRFEIKTASNVRISVYDLRGRYVATIVNQIFKAGEHTISWDRRTLGCGTYCVSMVAGNYHARVRMLVGR